MASQSTHLNAITIVDAHTHNLKHISLSIPRNQLVVFTGVSGSGKSTLAFNTIFAEGQRRYVERLSAYAKQFLLRFDKPDITAIEGLSPTIAIDQKTTQSSPRSTVGTLTEINDYLRVLYARIGTAHCPVCDAAVIAQPPSTIVEKLNADVEGFPHKAKVQVFSPMVRGRKGVYTDLLNRLRKQGYSRVRIDGELHLLEDLPENTRLERQKTHDIDVVTDRLVINRDDNGHITGKDSQRLLTAVEQAMKTSDGYARVQNLDGDEWFCSRHLACPNGHDLHGQHGGDELAPRMFSFNSPYGACTDCDGLGITMDVDVDRLVPDPHLSVEEGAIVALSRLLGRYARPFLKDLVAQYGIKPNTPWSKWPIAKQAALIYGEDDNDDTRNKPNISSDGWADGFEGVVPWLKQRYEDGTSSNKLFIRTLMEEIVCDVCKGARLKPLPLSVTIGDDDHSLNIAEFCKLTVDDALTTTRHWLASLGKRELLIGQNALHSVEQRLMFLGEVGLGYLSLDRRASTLSGGESQRIRLASQLGSGLSGVLYILDEPSIGLHPHNTKQLIETLKTLRDNGNSVLVVEHDEETIRQADWLVDIGPGAGRFGGDIVAEGPVAKLFDDADTPSSTLNYLTGKRTMPLPNASERRKGNGEALVIKGCTKNNLKNIDVEFPLNTLTCITGLSGSGKSTLMFDLLFPALEYHLKKLNVPPEGYTSLTGAEQLHTVVEIDQSPIGRTSRSMPVTYMGVFDDIRAVFAATETAEMYGYQPNFFSFNSAKGGRCPACKGAGHIKVEMGFLPDAKEPCQICLNTRYTPEALAVTYRDKTIADVLAMTVSESVEFFEHQPKICRQLNVLMDVGLGYLRLGQAAPTLSGGEAQRLKLATEFVKQRRGHTLYLLDEPTVGLHWEDVANLLRILNKLVDDGHTVMVIEHHTDVMRASDWIIDVGPGPGKTGGTIVATGTPETIARDPSSLTGKYL
jgi:excinuclease ABC subunit A